MFSVVMSVEIASRSCEFAGIAKDARNSNMRGSSECHSGGMLPCSILSASGERLEIVIASYMTPCPHGDSDAALNASRLYINRCLSMSALLMTVSHMISFGLWV